MEFTQFYIVLLRKGPTWSPEVTPQVEATQEKHLAHLASLTESGVLLLAGEAAQVCGVAEERRLHHG